MRNLIKRQDCLVTHLSFVEIALSPCDAPKVVQAHSHILRTRQMLLRNRECFPVPLLGHIQVASVKRHIPKARQATVRFNDMEWQHLEN
ncbi:MAG TPA: hypothetical protein PLL78_07920 [Fimbriimonadaceae bacterium]|nr:hypothetical protein [Fimbriimonadaceae bacterium]